MSQPGPIVIVSDEPYATLHKALSEAKIFPTVDATWREASTAIARVKPCAVIVAGQHEPAMLADIARTIEILSPYVPLIALDPGHTALPQNALPLTDIGGRGAHRLAARLNGSLRLRTLHATVLRRARDTRLTDLQMPADDPLQDATVLLAGRGGSFPALSVALGERMGIVGALSIEQAAKHLNARSFDGIVIGTGFTQRVVEAFLQVLSENARHRHLPVIVSGVPISLSPFELPNLEAGAADAAGTAAIAVPLIRQKAFEARLERASRSIEAGGLLDPRTGLLTEAAFNRDLSRLIREAHAQGAGLCLARFTLSGGNDRSRFDAARIIGQLMRHMDVGTLQSDGTIIVAFAGTGITDGRCIARRLASVLKQTVVSTKPNSKLTSDVAVTSLLPNDTEDSLRARLFPSDEQAAS